MKLFYSPGACSLASHIVLEETQLGATYEKVDLKSKTTESGADFKQLNPKGYVPALQLDNGELLTENMAILQYLAEASGKMLPSDPMRRWRALEATAFISTELHKNFAPLFNPTTTPEAKQNAKDILAVRFGWQAGWIEDGKFVMGDELTIADAYLYVMLRWAGMLGLDVPPALGQYVERMQKQPAVQRALAAEGLG